jgi:hypothetical protein
MRPTQMPTEKIWERLFWAAANERDGTVKQLKEQLAFWMRQNEENERHASLLMIELRCAHKAIQKLRKPTPEAHPDAQ